ncbi:hypothetical protein H4R18_005368 [Coemansia javaensis]|uniref:Adhesin domain-containing protein n=1 Tax=Coemansia javaensis TaxID=2761396 RepID=A0A9W8LEF2_9FUNG|nr:hypothetical protein H4R18_005368 [Coemansia javaensis]
MPGQRGPGRGRTAAAAAGGRRRGEPEQFPPLNEDGPPPSYSALDGGGGGGGDGAGELYRPGSFPGCAALQAGGGAAPRRAQRRRQRRRRRRGGWLCSGLCFVVGALLIAALGGSVLCVLRRAAPGPWGGGGRACARVQPAVERSFAVGAGTALRVASGAGVSATHVHLLRHNATDRALRLRAVVEAPPGAGDYWAARVRIDEARDAGGAALAVAVRVARPRWAWPRACVRVSLYVSAPGGAAGAFGPLRVEAAGAGAAWAVDAGALALGDVALALRSGPVQLRGLAVAGALHVATAHGRVSAAHVACGALAVASADAAVALANVTARAGRVDATTANAPISAADVTAAAAVRLRTSNAPLSLRAVAARAVAAETSNAAVRAAALAVRESAAVRTSNAPISAVDVTAAAAAPLALTLESSNGALELRLAGVAGGSFDVATTNARADVTAVAAAPARIRLVRDLDAHKTGSLGDPARAAISLATTNANAVLRFE